MAYNASILSQVHGPSIDRKIKKSKVNKKNKAPCSAVVVVDTQGGIWFGMDFYPKTQVSPILLSDDYFIKVDEIA